MVTIQLYNYNGAPNVINKQLGEHTDINGVLYDRTNVLQPVIKIERQPALFNYVYIVQLQRYYFVQSVTIEDSNFMTVSLTADTLKTYEAEIMAATATATQSDQPNYNSNNQPVYDVRQQLQQIEFENAFEPTGSVIMVTIKGN